jgi:hypothetical protein
VAPRYISKKHKNTDDEVDRFLKNVGKFLPEYAEKYNTDSNIFAYHISTTNFMAKAREERFEYDKNKVHIISAWRVCCLGNCCRFFLNKITQRTLTGRLMRSSTNLYSRLEVKVNCQL